MPEPTRLAAEDALLTRMAEAIANAWSLAMASDDMERAMTSLLTAVLPIFEAEHAEVCEAAAGRAEQGRIRAAAGSVRYGVRVHRVEQPIAHDGRALGVLSMDLASPSLAPDMATAWERLGAELGRMLHADAAARVRRDSLEALRTREAVYRGLVELSNDLIQSVDANGRILFANAAWRRAMGIEGTRVEGRSILDFVHPDCLEHCQRTMQQTFAGVPLQRATFAFRNALGSKVSVEGDVIPRIENGSVVSTQGFFRRVFVPGEDNAQSLRRLEIHDEAFEGSPEALVFLGVDGRVQRVNAEFTRLFGYSNDDAVGRLIDVLVVPERLRNEGADLCKRAGRSEVISIDTVRRRRDGTEIDVSLLATPVRVGGLQVSIQCIYRDIRDRKRLEAQLARSQRMEAVGRLAGGISHDFNNLLTVIHSTADMLFESLPKDSAVREEVNEIARAADRAASLTRQLLAFSRKQVLSPLVMNLNECASDVVRMLRRLIAEDIEIVTKFDSDIGMVMADPSQMEQVMMNLAINGRDAMPKGGTLTMSTVNATIEGEQAEQLALPPGRYVGLRVEDTGCGIPTELLDRIFEPFFSTKAESGNGTGLGLATVYGIVQQSNGAVAVSSEVGKGSSFTVWLPRCSENAHQRDQERKDRPSAQAETILVVEDDLAIRALVERALSKAGYHVLVADTPSEALDLLQKNPDVALLFTDVVMPQMNGPELAQKLQQQKPDLRVLFTSGYADDKVFQASGTPEGAHFLPKPYSFAGLATKIREALDAK